MESSRKQRWQQLQSVFEPGFKQMLLVSILLHLLLPIIYYSPFFPQREIEKPPVYRVNLVNKIVKNPQAGRPEAAPVKKKPVIKPKPKPKPAVKAKPIPPKPKPVPVKPKPIPPKPKPEPVKPKPVSKAEPVKKKPVVKQKPKIQAPSKKAKDTQADAIKAMQAKRDRQALIAGFKDELIELTEQPKSPITDAPVGMADGKGDEAGVSAIAFIQEFIQQQWNFSKYQAVGNPEAEAKLFYNTDGTLLHYKFLKKSGNSAFDESLIRAIAKSKQLPQSLPESMEFHIFFNLKDMLDSP